MKKTVSFCCASIRCSLAALAMFLGVGATSYAQLNLSAEQRAQVEKAIELMEGGKTAEAITILEAEEKLYPTMHMYPYEIGFAHSLKKDYEKALVAFRRAAAKPDATAQPHQMIGNTLDMMGKKEAALQAYADGLKKFPKAGSLFMETGVVYARQSQWAKAIAWYERGIAADPSYPSNYFKAADIFLHSTEKVWGMIYGEVAMNLERNTDRTREMSELLWRTYRKSITKTSDTSMSISFTKSNTITVGDAGRGKLPFGLLVFEPTMAMAAGTAMKDVDSLGTEEMCAVRSRFVQFYYETKRDKEYPNALFAYHKKVEAAGHLDAYNHWILLAGDEPAFDAWAEGHQPAWKRFIDWFKENPLEMTASNAFGSGH